MGNNFNYDVQMTTLAIEDLYKIKFYLDGFDPSIFISMTYQLEEIISNLKKQPYMYAEFKLIKGIHYRRVRIKRYLLIYDVDELNKTVYIDRVFHGLEDYERKIF